MDDKIYTYEVVQENPFPNEAVQYTAVNEGKGTTFSPATTKDKILPKKRTAVELLSSSLNTRSRNILREFVLAQSGGLKIGNFEDGTSGDIRITPNGITARDIAGLTTFALDALTGDATFKGIIQAGTFIAGDTSVVIESSNAGNGRIILYNNGIPAILIGDSD